MAPANTLWLEQCGSTQDLAWQLQVGDNPGGLFIVAGRQTAGRGRAAGRQWVSPPGNLYLSWKVGLQDPRGLALLGGLAVVRCLRQVGVGGWLKWPNDCWLPGGKVAGVLADCRWRGSQAVAAVLGIGLNLSSEGLPEEAVAVPGDQPASAMLARLQQELLLLLDLHRKAGLQGYLDEVRAVALPAGTEILYAQGGQQFGGRVAGLDEEGYLRLESGQVLSQVDHLRVVSHFPPPGA